MASRTVLARVLKHRYTKLAERFEQNYFLQTGKKLRLPRKDFSHGIAKMHMLLKTIEFAPANLLDACLLKMEFQPTRMPLTDAERKYPVGSPRRVAAYAMRVKRGISLFGDSLYNADEEDSNAERQ